MWTFKYFLPKNATHIKYIPKKSLYRLDILEHDSIDAIM